MSQKIVTKAIHAESINKQSSLRMENGRNEEDGVKGGT